LSHGYDDVDHQVLWDAVRLDVPVLLATVWSKNQRNWSGIDAIGQTGEQPNKIWRWDFGSGGDRASCFPFNPWSRV
jgi:hypothetical protein